MKEAKLTRLAKVKLNKPIIIEGLPGLGLVGKLAVDHLIKKLKAKKLAELHSPHFPPIVVIQKDGTTRMIKNEFYYVKRKGKKNDLVFLTGEHQGMTVESFYEHSGKIIDFAKSMNTSLMITLGGIAFKKLVNKPSVFGAATDTKLVTRFKKYGVKFDKPGSQISGAAGLMLGLGELQGMKGLCLMGETHGNYVDPNSAKAVLKVVEKILDIKLDYKELEKHSKQMKNMMKKMQEMQTNQPKTLGERSDTDSYIR